MIVIATRFGLKLGPADWGNTTIAVDTRFAGCYRDVFTGKDFCNQQARNVV